MLKEADYQESEYWDLKAIDNDFITNYKSKGSSVIYLSNLDGTIRYGTYEQPFYLSPYNMAEPSKNKALPY